MTLLYSPPVHPRDTEHFVSTLGIKDHDLVLEVGAGHNPLKRSNVVLDIDFYNGLHRDGLPIRIDSQKHYVQGDITHLPFKEKSFDWVVCLHVLEHVNDPHKACLELMRVAKKGFFEVPRKWTEFFAGHPTHKWLVDVSGDTVIFEAIDWDESPFLNFALPPVWDSELLLKRAEETYRHVACIQFVWKDRFDFMVLGEEKSKGYISKESQAVKHFNFAKNLLYWGADPHRGIFHAREAYLLSEREPRYRALYSTYLILCGDIKRAIDLGIRFCDIPSVLWMMVLLKMKRLFQRVLFEWVNNRFSI